MPQYVKDERFPNQISQNVKDAWFMANFSLWNLTGVLASELPSRSVAKAPVKFHIFKIVWEIRVSVSVQQLLWGDYCYAGFYDTIPMKYIYGIKTWSSPRLLKSEHLMMQVHQQTLHWQQNFIAQF